MAAPADPTASAGRTTGASTPRQRTRLVLAEVTRQRRDPDRTRTELAEQTRVGEALVRGLVRAQLALALRLSLVVAIGLGGLPLLFAVAPAVGAAKIFGINLPWLLLGVAAFPFLVGVGWIFVRLAERNEQDFTALVRRPER
ncbi:hypothetical protein [Micromonospora sp. NPDC049679]|uniref:hypothetical protein n=1 Tax=Micromonospora sp. NPDC049679 TaxID=3155920 RepID=UPI0033CE999D